MQTFLNLLSKFRKKNNKKSTNTSFVYLNYYNIKKHYKKTYFETYHEKTVITDIKEPIFN